MNVNNINYTSGADYHYPKERQDPQIPDRKFRDKVKKAQEEREYLERLSLRKKRLNKYIKRLQEKKVLQKEALEKAVKCEKIEYREMSFAYWQEKATEGNASPGMLVRVKKTPKAKASSYETSFMLKDSAR